MLAARPVSQPWFDRLPGRNELTAAMMPAVPAPKIATFVFRHVVLGVKGVPKAGKIADDIASTSAKPENRDSWGMLF